MGRIKSNIWALILFVISLVTLGVAIYNAVVTFLGLENAVQVAIQAAKDAGTTDEELLQIAANAARIGAIIGLVFSLLISVLVALGGIFYSTKGTWKTFCLIVAILDIIGLVLAIISFFGNPITLATIINFILSIITDLLFVISVFALRAQDKK